MGKDHPTVLSVHAPKEVGLGQPTLSFLSYDMTFRAQIADVEGACQGLLGLEPL